MVVVEVVVEVVVAVDGSVVDVVALEAVFEAVDVPAVVVVLETLQVDQRNLEDYWTDPRVVA